MGPTGQATGSFKCWNACNVWWRLDSVRRKESCNRVFCLRLLHGNDLCLFDKVYKACTWSTLLCYLDRTISSWSGTANAIEEKLKCERLQLLPETLIKQLFWFPWAQLQFWWSSPLFSYLWFLNCRGGLLQEFYSRLFVIIIILCLLLHSYFSFSFT